MLPRALLIACSTVSLVACSPDEAVRDATVGEVNATTEREAAVVDLAVEQLAERLEAGNVRLIDVRTDEEVSQGIIPGAEQIMLDDFDPASLDLSDGREVVLYCRSGRRSGIAAERLAEHTGEPAQHLEGGIIAWREAGQPVETP